MADATKSGAPDSTRTNTEHAGRTPNRSAAVARFTWEAPSVARGESRAAGILAFAGIVLAYAVALLFAFGILTDLCVQVLR